MSNYLVSANDLTAISLGEQDTVASVLQNIAVILSTPKGTVPGYREFGIDISDRITPAQAGKSVAPRQKRSALWDHPRVGGEKMFVR